MTYSMHKLDKEPLSSPTQLYFNSEDLASQEDEIDFAGMLILLIISSQGLSLDLSLQTQIQFLCYMIHLKTQTISYYITPI
jgi:hypothetical protein